MPKPTGFIAEVAYTIAGIPCIIGVVSYHVQPGDRSTWDSDWDYYGYTEVEYLVLDRKGYSAEWLARKVSDSDNSEIEAAIARHFETADQY